MSDFNPGFDYVNRRYGNLVTDRVRADRKLTLEDVKPFIDEALTFFKNLDDYGTKAPGDALFMLYNMPNQLMGAINSDSIQYSSNCLLVGQYLLQQDYYQPLVQIAKTLTRKLTKTNSNDTREPSVFQCQLNLYPLVNIFNMYTNVDPSVAVPVCRSLCKHGILGVLLKALTYLDNPANQLPDIDSVLYTLKTKMYVLGAFLSIIKSCPDYRQRYHNANVISILSEIQKPYMEVRLLSLLILAYIVDEKENEKLTKSEDCIRFLTELFTKAVHSSKHVLSEVDLQDFTQRCLTYSAKELLDGLNHLAVNDANKREIYKHGGIPAIIRMLQPDFSEDERRVAIEALWNLSFVDEIKTNVNVQKSTLTLQRLARSPDKSVREASVYALWEISDNQIRVTDETQPTESPPSHEETVRRDAIMHKTTGDHVMLSYQWASQETVLSIRDTLTSAGYNVWIDADKIRGDTLKAMSKAVENSSVVVVCLTENYKDSASCRSEASYASKLKKPIIPLLMESAYTPDGWLGQLLGTKMYLDFSTDDERTRSMQRLIKEIGNCGRNDTKQDELDEAASCHPQEAEQPQFSASQSNTKPTNADISVSYLV